jgi:MFS transporter, SP family, general alpha glucoside:H+ symporter
MACSALSLAMVMEGYDTALINALYAFPKFQERYGIRIANGSYQISTAW